jgi:hypothetical protein
MAEWLSYILWSGLLGGLVGALVALLHEWWYIGPLRRRCWRAEITLAQLRADPEGQALLERLAALRRLTDEEDLP